jgi:hypothetical protein
MGSSLATSLRTGFCIVFAFLLAGCETMPGGAPDSTRLLNAIVADDARYVREMIESGRARVDQRIPAPVYMEGTPLITIAARAASLDVLRYLIKAGADVNARTPADETALMLAAFFQEEGFLRASTERHEAAMRLLVAAGADIENTIHSYTPLAYAAYQGRERVVRFLLERGARVNGDAQDGLTYVNTPLMMAAMMGHLDCVVTLLRAGADPRIRLMGGHTARELALKHGHARVMQTLACAETQAPGALAAARCS